MKHIKSIDQFLLEKEERVITTRLNELAVTDLYDDIAKEIESMIGNRTRGGYTAHCTYNGKELLLDMEVGKSSILFTYDKQGKLHHDQLDDDWSKRMRNNLPKELKSEKDLNKLDKAMLALAGGKIVTLKDQRANGTSI
jgi:hypothetical protein